MPSVQNKQGFTLVELMVVVTIIGVVLAAALPSMGSTLADQRASRLTRDIVRLYQQARYSAMRKGKAQLVQFWGAGSAGEPYTFEVYESNVVAGTCHSTEWTTLTNNFGDPDCANRPSCVDSLEPVDYDPNLADDNAIAIAAADTRLAHCYEPSGKSLLWLTQAGVANWTNYPDKTGGAILGVSRKRGTDLVGVTRNVFLPWGNGTPRVAGP